MKRKIMLSALFAILLSLGASIKSEAGPWCRHHRGWGYYHPRARVVVAPAPPPIVVVRPGWGYRPHYYQHRVYRPHYYSYRPMYRRRW